MERLIHINGGYPSKTEFLAALKAGVELYDISLSRCVWWDDILQRVAFCSMEPAAAVQAIADRRSWKDFEFEMVLPKDLSDFYVRRYYNRTYFINE